MARVLLAWELGAGFGHVRPLLQIATRLADAGHSPLMALKSPVECWSLLEESGIPFVPAPQSTQRSPKGFQAGSFADVLAVRGFADRHQLAPLVEAWRHLIEQTGARLVVAEHAPSACLAAAGRVPVILTGSGFTLPPDDGATFPVFDESAPKTNSEATVLSVVKDVLKARGQQVPAALPEIFRVHEKFIYTYPELDPYQRSDEAATFGPLHAVPARSTETPTMDFFAYLGGNTPGVEHIFRSLSAAGLRGSCYLRQPTDALVRTIRDLGITVHGSPPSLAEELPRCRVVLHHGGVGTAQDALSVGRPQLLFPLHVEMQLTANALEAMGVARYLAGATSLSDLQRTIHETFTDQELARNAETLAQRIEERGPSQCLDRLVQRCLELLDAG